MLYLGFLLAKMLVKEWTFWTFYKKVEKKCSIWLHYENISDNLFT